MLIKEKIKNTWDKTAGYKTASGGVLLLIFQLFQLIWPEAIGKGWEDWIYNAIGAISATGLIDKIIRYKIKKGK